jgi:hypothetical protein
VSLMWPGWLHLAACLPPTSICLSLSCRLPSSYHHLPLTILQPAFVLPASASRYLAACLRPTSICLSPSCRLPPSYQHLPLAILQPASVLPASASHHLAACLCPSTICLRPSCRRLATTCLLTDCRIDLTRAAHQRFSFCHNFLWQTSLLLKTSRAASRAESSRW